MFLFVTDKLRLDYQLKLKGKLLAKYITFKSGFVFNIKKNFLPKVNLL